MEKGRFLGRKVQVARYVDVLGREGQSAGCFCMQGLGTLVGTSAVCYLGLKIQGALSGSCEAG